MCTPEKASRLRQPEDLFGETLLHTLARPDDWQKWLCAAAVPHLDSRQGPHYESSALAYEAALEGYGVVIAQKALVERELSEGRLVAPFELFVDAGPNTYYFLLPKESYRRPSRELVQFRRWVTSFAI